MSKLILQVNKKFREANTTLKLRGGSVAMITPPLDEGYWMYRVAVSDKQAIVGFPKFNTIGIGFQHEKDWNTNLPFTCPAQEIYNHIRHNKDDVSIRKGKVLSAIMLVQEAAAQRMGKKETP